MTDHKNWAASAANGLPFDACGFFPCMYMLNSSPAQKGGGDTLVAGDKSSHASVAGPIDRISGQFFLSCEGGWGGGGVSEELSTLRHG